MSRTKIAEYVLEQPFEERYSDSEVAAWYTTHRFEPQIADVFATIVQYGDGLPRVDSWGYKLEGVVIDEYHAALYGGLPVLSGPYEPRGLGEKQSRPFSGHGFSLAHTMATQSTGQRRGTFIPVVDMYVRGKSLSSQTSLILPNPGCAFCGQTLRRTTEDEWKAVAEFDYHEEFKHVDGDEAEAACVRDHPQVGWRPKARPAKEFVREYTRMHMHYTLFLGTQEN